MMVIAWNVVPFIAISVAGPYRSLVGNSWFRIHKYCFAFFMPIISLTAAILAIIKSNVHFNNAHKVTYIFLWFIFEYRLLVY